MRKFHCGDLIRWIREGLRGHEASPGQPQVLAGQLQSQSSHPFCAPQVLPLSVLLVKLLSAEETR